MFELEFEFFTIFKVRFLHHFFRNFQKVRNRTNSEYSVNLEYSETPVFAPKPLFLPQKQGFLTHKLGFLTQTYFQTIFAKFLRVQKKPGYL